MIRKNTLVTMLLAAVLIFSFVSCDPTEKYEDQEQDNIDNYLSASPNLAFERKASGLYFYEYQAGTGSTAQPTDTAFVFYTGKLLNGYIFDSNVGKDTLEVAMNGNWVKGFAEGLSYMTQGSKAIFLLPSALAYGPYGQYPIPGYTPLLFDVTIVKIKHGPAK